MRLPQRLVDITPGDFDKKVWLGLHGSDANDCLAKLLPVATGRRGLIGAYHGQTAGAAALSGHGARTLAGSAGHVTEIPYPDPYRPVFGGHHDPADAVLGYLRDYIFKTISPPEDTAAIFVEALQSDAGDIVPAPHFLQGLERLCREHEIMLVIDEVKTGFGRTATPLPVPRPSPTWTRWSDSRCPSRLSDGAAFCSRASEVSRIGIRSSETCTGWA